MENQFVFDHFGSDIRALAKPTMISSCTANGCAWASNIPYIRAMRLELGSERDTYLGLLSIDAMENSLLNLRRPFFVEKLTLHFRIFPTHALDNLDSLILALQSIKVARILTITGPGKFQFVAAAIDIAGSLGLVPRPTWEFIKPSRGRDYAPTVKRRGFSYFRFKVDNATPDYDSYEGALIQKAVLKGAHIHGFNMWV